MKKKEFKIEDIITDSIVLKTKLLEKEINNIQTCADTLAQACKNSKKIMFCGNGGSAADCQHLAAELVIRLRGHINRAAIPAMALTVDPSIMTAGGNDIGFENVFAREVEAYGQEGDVLVGISTSGNSANVINAMLQAKKQGITTVAFLGASGGKMLALADQAVLVPSCTTARIQEAHIMIGHICCEIIEMQMFPELFK